MEKFSSYTGIQYSPQDMAEYVFWTGDEKGVTLAIEEFLQEGLVSIHLLVKINIKYCFHYKSLIFT